MSLSQDTMLELMQYADGELDGDARARIEGLLRTNEEARGVVAAMGMLGDVVRDGIDARVDRVAAGGIADAVMAAINGERAGVSARPPIDAKGESAGVLSARPPIDAKGESAGVLSARPPIDAKAREERAAVVPLVAKRRGRVGVTSAVVAVLALAAGVVLFVRSAGLGGSGATAARPNEERYGSAPGEPAAESASAHGKALAQTETLGVDLEEVRSVENKVDVFFTPPAKSAAASVVVWIDDRHEER